MSNQILQPQLQAVASPVDRFVAPRMEVVPNTNPWLEVAKGLAKINPEIQSYLEEENRRFAERETAAGVTSEMTLDQSVHLDENAKDWKSLIDKQRRADETNGTAYADDLMAASPHFRRGLLTARAQRIGMGLDAWLSEQYAAEGSGIPTGDPAAISNWVMQKTNEYATKFGLNQLDPVITAQVFVPLAVRAQQNLVANHKRVQAATARASYDAEIDANIGMILSGAQPAPAEAAPAGTTVASSKGGWAAHDPDARYGTPGGEPGVTAPAAPAPVAMDAAPTTGGVVTPPPPAQPSYSPSAPATAPDGPPPAVMEIATNLQNLMDQSIAVGMPPSKINKKVVDAVVAEAVAQNNVDVLSVLDQINAGSGPLGNIAWVKEERTKAIEQITDDIWEEEQRANTRFEKWREESANTIRTEGYRALIQDPTADISQYVDLALQTGNGELAKGLRDYQRTLLDQANTVTTDPGVIGDIRYRLAKAATADEIDRIFDEASYAAANRLISPSDYAALYDDREKKLSYSTYQSSQTVRRQMDTVESMIAERFGTKDMFGNSTPYHEKQADAVIMFEAMMDAELAKRPDMSKAEYDLLAIEARRKVLEHPDFQLPAEPAMVVPPSTENQPQQQPGFFGRLFGSNAQPEPAQAPAQAPSPATTGFDSMDDKTKAYLGSEDGYNTLVMMAEVAGLTPAEFAVRYGIME